MKTRKPIKYPAHKSSGAEVKESAVAEEVQTAPMVRTQIYLNREEYDFVQTEARRRNEPMAAVIRNFIDEKMEIPETPGRTIRCCVPGRMIRAGKATKTAGSITIIIFTAARRNGLKSKANMWRLRLCRRTITKIAPAGTLMTKCCENWMKPNEWPRFSRCFILDRLSQ